MISAQVRGQPRRFKSEASAKRDVLAKVLGSQAILILAVAFCGARGERHRRQMLAKLRATLDPVATFFEHMPKPSRAGWASIVPAEKGATVEAILVARGHVRRAHWNLLASEHALERFYERGGIELEAALIEGNYECGRGRFHKRADGSEVIDKAGAGAIRRAPGTRRDGHDHDDRAHLIARGPARSGPGGADELAD